MRTSGVILFGLVLAVGCAENAPPQVDAPAEPISRQIQLAAPELRGIPFINLLNFESSSDAVFVSANGLRSHIDTRHTHTGRSGIRFDGKGEATIKLGSLIGTHPFPGSWTLAGAYFYSEQPARVTLSCSVGGVVIARHAVAIPADQWTAGMVDLSTPIATTQPGGEGSESMSVTVDAPTGVWCDDVVLLDNTVSIIGNFDDNEIGRWSVCRRGFNIICTSVGRFSTRLAAADAQPDGWKLEEACEMRARFSSTGKSKLLTIYADGRSYWDGKLNPLTPDVRSEPLWQAQQDSPAEIQVAEAMGRVDRLTSGDDNNDGYNESRASYMVIATGPRLAVTILPRTVPAYRPVLEVKGLPMGSVLVTVEGRLVENNARLDDGTFLAEIPARIERPTTVIFRVQ